MGKPYVGLQLIKVLYIVYRNIYIYICICIGISYLKSYIAACFKSIMPAVKWFRYFKRTYSTHGYGKLGSVA